MKPPGAASSSGKSIWISNMAAVSQLVLNDLLCFSVNKFGKMPLRTLKTMLVDFYHVDLLTEAKVRLLMLNDVKDMNMTGFATYSTPTF